MLINSALQSYVKEKTKYIKGAMSAGEHAL